MLWVSYQVETEEERKESEYNEYRYKRASGLDGMKIGGEYGFNFEIGD